LKIFGLLGLTTAASAGLCGAAVALSPAASPAPLPMGGPTCVEQSSGLAGPVAPGALPGPLAPVVPAAPVLPVVPVVPVAGGAPVAGGPVVPVGVPVATGKGVPTNPGQTLASDPVVLPGPPPVKTPAPVAGATLTGAIESLPCCGNP
jgi:hypothetical protein